MIDRSNRGGAPVGNEGSGRPPDGPVDVEEDRVVLVVDDEADLLQIVSDRLAAAGYRVLTARDGIEALARAREVCPGCIILDLKMPRLGGFEALPEIRQVAPTARVIVLTGSPNRPLREACRARGADEFMLKPFDPGELLRLTAQAFGRE
jgi:CheY-like chemotaxis protein